jgi:hypothetical protein
MESQQSACSLAQSQSQSNIATDDRSISKPSCRASSGAHDQIIITVLELRSLFLWGTLSDQGTGLSFVYSAGPRHRSLSRALLPWVSRPYFNVSI